MFIESSNCSCSSAHQTVRPVRTMQSCQPQQASACCQSADWGGEAPPNSETSGACLKKTLKGKHLFRLAFPFPTHKSRQGEDAGLPQIESKIQACIQPCLSPLPLASLQLPRLHPQALSCFQFSVFHFTKSQSAPIIWPTSKQTCILSAERFCRIFFLVLSSF